MAGTRSSARQAEKNQSSPPSSASKSGTKRKADDQSSPSSASKRGRPAKDQKTLEETIKNGDDQEDVDEGFDEEMKDEMLQKEEAATEDASKAEAEPSEGSKAETNGKAEEGEKNETNGDKGALDQVKADANEEGKTSKKEEEETTGETAKGEAVEEDKKREEAQPSNVLEKGVIYFFTRGRVGVDDPDSVQDLQRSFFVLRPLPPGGKLTDGAVQDVGNNRLIALPKKVFPRNGKDRFMAFTEKAKVSMDTLKEEFFQGSSYSTQTTGTRHTPEVTPVGEGVYAITSTGGGQGTTHLAYMLTIPSAIGEVQKDLGLAEKGSFALSLKNPESSAPVNALPNAAEYSKEIIDEFRGRGWMPAVPKHLDYVNSSFLMIGEGDFENSSNLDPAPKDEKDGNKETPQEELEKLEGEDEHRVDNLKGDDTIFADLGISSKEYPKVLTTW